MTRVRVTVPATSTNLGPGLDCMALALGLHCIVEISEIEYGLQFDHPDQGANPRLDGTTNLVLKAMSGIFRAAGYLPGGLHIRMENNIPPGNSLGGDTAALLGGAIAANILLGSPFNREEILEHVFAIEKRPSAALAALLGGLIVNSNHNADLVYAPVQIAPMAVAIVMPAVRSDSPVVALPQQVSLSDAIFDIGHAALVVQALVAGDYDLLARAMHDRLHEAAYSKAIPAYEQMLQAAYQCGATAVAISGTGPALIAFAAADHGQIARAMARAYQKATQNKAQSWVLPVDTQGVSISEMGMASSAKPLPASEHPVSFPEQTSLSPSPNPDITLNRANSKHTTFIPGAERQIS